METNDSDKTGMDRRRFMQASALATGASVITAKKTFAAGSAQPTVGSSDDLNVAFLGMGAQGQQLLESAKIIPGLRFRAVCDIWERSQRIGKGRLRQYGHDVTVYEDYQEMLDNEDLDAVIVATPDWMHAEHANACMRKGVDVYCEKEMSNSLEKARSMVETARETGKLLQIGHQRRSNPRYIHAVERLIKEERLLGRVTQAYAQWNRAKSDDLTVPRGNEISQETLDRYGYGNTHQFMNWRWFKKYGGGPIVDLGSHQIDIFAWVFGTNPRSVIASGGVDFYDNHEWYDTVMAIYEFENEFGVSRAMYQVLTTTSSGGFYEKFMGVDGTLNISEVTFRANAVEKEVNDDNKDRWAQLARQGMLNPIERAIKPVSTKQVAKDVRESPPLPQWPLPVVLNKPAHTPHLENFFGAIRHGEALNCPPETGYETAVAVLTVNEAVEAQRRLAFEPEDFEV